MSVLYKENEASNALVCAVHLDDARECLVRTIMLKLPHNVHVELERIAHDIAHIQQWAEYQAGKE
jgi:hypothetical protein